jgi:hypothetical protein
MTQKKQIYFIVPTNNNPDSAICVDFKFFLQQKRSDQVFL